MSKILEYFFEAYFHQDWREDCQSSLDVVTEYINSETDNNINDLYIALKNLLSSEVLPQDTFNKLGGNFKPETEGMTVGEWIVRAIKLFDEKCSEY